MTYPLFQYEGPEEVATDSDDNYTPPEVIEAARLTMDGIEFDPCSSYIANSQFVKADAYCTIKHDCLSLPTWECESLWFNPPYSDPMPFIQRLAKEFMDGRVKQFTGVLNYDNTRWSGVLYPVCTAFVLLTDNRISFFKNDNGRIVQRGSNPRPQILFYGGGHAVRFVKYFRQFGRPAMGV